MTNWDFWGQIDNMVGIGQIGVEVGWENVCLDKMSDWENDKLGFLGTN